MTRPLTYCETPTLRLLKQRFSTQCSDVEARKTLPALITIVSRDNAFLDILVR